MDSDQLLKTRKFNSFVEEVWGGSVSSGMTGHQDCVMTSRSLILLPSPTPTFLGLCLDLQLKMGFPHVIWEWGKTEMALAGLGSASDLRRKRVAPSEHLY